MSNREKRKLAVYTPSSEEQIKAHNEQHPKTVAGIQQAHRYTRAMVNRMYGDDAKPMYVDKINN